MILSLEQTEDVKPVKEEVQPEEEPAAVLDSSPTKVPLLKEEEEEEEQATEVDVIKLFTQTVEEKRSSSLYEQLKEKPEALTLLAPAAGDSFISLDFSYPGRCTPGASSVTGSILSVALTPALSLLQTQRSSC